MSAGEYNIHDLRRRALEGHEVTLDEMRRAVDLLAPHRAGAIDAADAASERAATTKRASPTRTAPLDLGDLLNG